MGMLSKMMKAGVAKKAIDEARKPHNQAKARSLFAKARQGRGTRPPRPR